MIDWSIIDSTLFEELAYDYISNQYTNLKWEKTKISKDGNRDGESSFFAPLSTTIKYWYEAKYSIDTNKSIPKSHLDSTLVSCMLDGKVAALAFITNAYISEDYRRRADTFARHSDNLKIIYVNGEELENWLYENPEIELKYFYEKNASRNTIEEGVKNICILQNYDFYGNSFCKTNTLETGKEYVLYISFYSNCFQKGFIDKFCKIIELISNDDRPFYDNYKEISFIKGYNSFYFPFKVKDNSEQRIKMAINCNHNSYQIIIDNIMIIDIYNPIIHYASQIETQIKLYNLINDRDTSNGVFMVCGTAGSGKSYLLNSIYNNTINPFNSFVVRFTGNIEQDAVSCFKIIIISLYGDIWKYLKSDSEHLSFNEIESMMIQQIVENKASLGLIDQVSRYYKTNNKSIESNVSSKHIFIDDLHKLSSDNLLLINSFLEWFINQRFNCKIYLFSRTCDEKIKFITKKYEIDNITINDVSTTLKLNFNQSLLVKLIKRYPAPLNVLHFLNILNRIHEYEKNFQKYTELEFQILINKIYSETSFNTSISFGKQIIDKFKNDPLVYCVYKIDTGISFRAICGFFEEGMANIYNLCRNRIIKESSNQFYPYHDILKSAFKDIKSKEMDDILERFILFAEKNNEISKSKMFSVLIHIGNNCFWKYKSRAEAYRDTLHANADYIQALQIARALKENNTKCYSDYSADDCKNQFIFANCTKYTRSYKEANEEFEKISELYSVSKDPGVKSISLEAKTEIINNDIWMLEMDQAKNLLNEVAVIFDELYRTRRIKGHSLTYAFLNYYNRQMFVNYMIDEGSEKDYKAALAYSNEFNKSEYIAFAKMDYAKCLYNTNLQKALSLMKEALMILDSMGTERRRTLDAKSEIWFLNCLNKEEIVYSEYFELKDNIKKNHYIQSLIKIQLKMIMLEIIFGNKSSDSLRNDLEIISINNSSISSGKRHQAYIYHLYSATYYIDNNLYNARLYSKKCLNLLKQMGESYKTVHEQNIRLNEYNGFTSINESNHRANNQFILDIRLW